MLFIKASMLCLKEVTTQNWFSYVYITICYDRLILLLTISVYDY